MYCYAEQKRIVIMNRAYDFSNVYLPVLETSLEDPYISEDWRGVGLCSHHTFFDGFVYVF